MEMIATARMKRAQEQATAGRPYAGKIRQVVSDLALHPEGSDKVHPLLQKRNTTKTAIIHITTDHGLCGGLNANQNRLVASSILEQNVPVTLIIIGRKGRNFARITRCDTCAVFTDISDSPKLQETLPISRVIINGYSKGEFDLVYLAYPRFTSTIKQTPVMEILLPVEPSPSLTLQA
jgi:F-type H+-transporting ATPase subunit gamma